MALDYSKLRNWPFAPQRRNFGIEDLVRYARGFGAGYSGAMTAADRRYIDGVQALPMAAVALADGEFWQSNPATGIDWAKIVHAEEGITVHRPLPLQGQVTIEHRVVDLFDRGAARGAMMLEQLVLHDEAGDRLVTIDVTTVLRGDGGFGGAAPPAAPRLEFPDTAPDAVLDVASPPLSDKTFQIAAGLDVAAGIPGKRADQAMLRGVGAFGLAGRAVLHLVCGDDAARLRKLAVRYSGPLLTDETARIELWHSGAGKAVFRMRALERDAAVLNNCVVEFLP